MAYRESGVEREIGSLLLQKTHPAATYFKMLRGIFKMHTGKHDFF